jgi:hypothetical protein
MKFSRETKNYLSHVVDEMFKTAVEQARRDRDDADAKAQALYARFAESLDTAKARFLAEVRGIAKDMGLAFADGYSIDHAEVFSTPSSHSELARWCFVETSCGAEGSPVKALSDVVDAVVAARDRARGRALLEIECAKDAAGVEAAVRRVCAEELDGVSSRVAAIVQDACAPVARRGSRINLKKEAK